MMCIASDSASVQGLPRHIYHCQHTCNISGTWSVPVSLSTQRRLTTCYASHHYKTERVISVEGIVPA